MDDHEMAKLRAQRMSQMQANQGGSRADAEQQKQAAEQQELMKTNILKQASFLPLCRFSYMLVCLQVLDQQALGRLSNLAAVRPAQARAVENLVIQMARTGQIAEKLDDAALRGLLEKVSAQQQKTTTVKFDRRRAALDSDDED
ncbi:hypothetical protein M3Y99_01157700 [Aphelenchoides fujianensis]|nr:hypothetical protein M3Y99_01157700 [Aphelenchoides fujianensis]